eukprot:1150293-Pelagomonas_calceolata.AAC.9
MLAVQSLNDQTQPVFPGPASSCSLLSLCDTHPENPLPCRPASKTHQCMESFVHVSGQTCRMCWEWGLYGDCCARCEGEGGLKKQMPGRCAPAVLAAAAAAHT